MPAATMITTGPHGPSALTAIRARADFLEAHLHATQAAVHTLEARLLQSEARAARCRMALEDIAKRAAYAARHCQDARAVEVLEAIAALACA